MIPRALLFALTTLTTGAETCAIVARAQSPWNQSGAVPTRGWQAPYWQVPADYYDYHTPTDGVLAPAAADYLNARYQPAREHGYCVMAWHVGLTPVQDTAVVIDLVVAADSEVSGPREVDFACGPGVPTLHTHPEDFCRPSNADIRTGMIDAKLPFVAIQCQIGQFAFWIDWPRVAALKGLTP